RYRSIQGRRPRDEAWSSRSEREQPSCGNPLCLSWRPSLLRWRWQAPQWSPTPLRPAAAQPGPALSLAVASVAAVVRVDPRMATMGVVDITRSATTAMAATGVTAVTALPAIMDAYRSTLTAVMSEGRALRAADACDHPACFAARGKGRPKVFPGLTLISFPAR